MKNQRKSVTSRSKKEKEFNIKKDRPKFLEKYLKTVKELQRMELEKMI